MSDCRSPLVLCIDPTIRCFPKGAFILIFENRQSSFSYSSLHPQTQPMYMQRSGKGGLVTILVAFTLLILAWGEAREYLYGKYGYSFDVDHHIGQQMQINVDVTVAMKCHCEYGGGRGMKDDPILLLSLSLFRSHHRYKRRCGRSTTSFRL